MVLASEDSGMKREALAATFRLLISTSTRRLRAAGARDHALGLVEHDPRLVAGGGGGVDLRALLAVGDQQVEPDAGRERGLAVLPRHGAVGGAEAPEAIAIASSRTGADDERLPGSEREGLPGPLALAVAQEAEEVDRVPGRLRVEAQPSVQPRPRSSRWRSQARRTRRLVRICPSVTARA